MLIPVYGDVFRASVGVRGAAKCFQRRPPGKTSALRRILIFFVVAGADGSDVEGGNAESVLRDRPLPRLETHAHTNAAVARTNVAAVRGAPKC